MLTSVVPAGTANWSDYLDKLNQEPDFVIEAAGNVFPTDESRRPGKVAAMEATEAGTNSKSSEVSREYRKSGDNRVGAIRCFKPARQSRYSCFNRKARY